MTDFTQLTDKELSEAIDFHRRQRNLSRGVNEAMHMRQVQNVRLLEAEEARRLEEAEKTAYHYYVTHNRGDKNSDWTVTHAKKKPFATARDAADHIARSGGRQSGTVHTVNAKTGNIVQARSYDSGQAGYPRDPGIGDPRHIRDLKEEAEQIDELSNTTLQRYKSGANKVIDNSNDSDEIKKRGKGYALASKKLTARILKKEEVEQIDELSKKTLGSYVKKAGGTSLNSAGAHMADYGANSNQKSFKKGINRAKGVMRAADRLTKEEVEELDELSKDTLNSYWKKAATARYPLDVKARKAQDQKTNRIRSGKPLAGYKPKDELSADEKRTHMNRIHGMNRAGKTLFRSEEVELNEDTMPSNVASRLSDRHFTAAFSHKKNGNMKGYAAHLKVANRIEDAVIRAGSHMPIKSKQIEAASDKAFKEHPHRAVKTEEVELDEANKPNQYIEVTNKFTGAKSYHEVHPSKAFAALNRHNSLWSTKSSRIVSGKEAEGIRASKMKKEEVEQLAENPWNQKFQKAPTGDTLPTPAKGTVPKHGMKFKEGDQVIVHAGPHAGERHTVTYARTGSVNLLHPSPKNKYDTTTVRAKHEHLSPYKGSVKEEVELDEASIDDINKAIMAKHRENLASVKSKQDSAKVDRINKQITSMYSAVSKHVADFNKKNEEVELDEASYRDIGYANMLKADRKAEKELAKLRAQQAKAAAKTSKPEEFKEEAGLRVTKVYNKWPKKATYAVHNADRSYHKEFDSMEDAQAHKAEKSK